VTELTSTPYQLARRTDAATAEEMRGLQGLRVMTRTDGTLFVLFESRYRLERLQSEHPDWFLATTVPSE
jgi:peptide chain release factor 3